MKTSLLTCILLLTIVLSSCASRTEAQEPTVNLSAIQNAPNELPSFELSIDGTTVQIPNTLPPEVQQELATPVFHYAASIIDTATGQPVRANVYIVDQVEYSAPTVANLMDRATAQVRLSVRRSPEIHGPDDAVAWLVVEAPGYKQSVSRINYWVEQTERYQGVVRMVRVEEF